MKYDLNFKLDFVVKYKEGRLDRNFQGQFSKPLRLWVNTFDELGIDGLKCIKKGRPVKDGRTI